MRPVVAMLLLWGASSTSTWAQGLPTCDELDDAFHDVDRRSLRRQARLRRRATRERVGLFRNTAWLALRTWQVVVSPGDGATCTKYPSCSSYGVRAIREQGALAPFLTAHRLLSDHGDPSHERCLVNGRVHLYDPVEHSVFWRSR